MAKITGLYRRDKVWYCRIWIPADLHQRYQCHEVKRSLRTTFYNDATATIKRIHDDVHQQFMNARSEASNGILDRNKLFQFSVPVPIKNDNSAPSDSTLNVAYPVQNIADIQAIVKMTTEAVLTSLGHHVSKQDPMTITDLFNDYMADPSANRSAKSIIEYNSVFGVLTELVGTHTSIYDIDRKSCRDVMEVLRHMPPNATKRFPGKSWSEVSTIARDRKLKPLSPATVNKYLANLSSVFNWAVKEGILNRNPATGLAVADTVRAKDKRLPFTSDQLKRIFSDPVFVDRDYGTRPSRYWVPLIGYYSGMRLNEICQLNQEDVREFNGVLCFHITASINKGVNDKVLKTVSSERVVPVHPKLEKLGFMSYHHRMPITGKLFPDITMASNGYRSDTFTKYFQRFLKKCGAKSDRTSFHSFRHNFRDELRNSNINHEIVLALGGWVGDAGIEANYGRGYSASVLLNAISTIKPV